MYIESIPKLLIAAWNEGHLKNAELVELRTTHFATPLLHVDTEINICYKSETEVSKCQSCFQCQRFVQKWVNEDNILTNFPPEGSYAGPFRNPGVGVPPHNPHRAPTVFVSVKH